MVTVTEPVDEHRVADDYDMATALGYNPDVYKYSQTEDCPPRHLAQLARQELHDLQKVVQTNAVRATMVRQEQQQQITELNAKSSWLNDEHEKQRVLYLELEKMVSTLQEVIVKQAALIEGLERALKKPDTEK